MLNKKYVETFILLSFLNRFWIIATVPVCPRLDDMQLSNPECNCLAHIFALRLIAVALYRFDLLYDDASCTS